MRIGIRSFRFSPVCRALDVCCALMVISNILFNVLDLDGSEFLRIFNSVEKITMMAVVSTEGRLDFSPEKFERRRDGLLLFAGGSGEYGRPHYAEIQNFSQLHEARAHGYRVGLARNSLSDSSPYF